MIEDTEPSNIQEEKGKNDEIFMMSNYRNFQFILSFGSLLQNPIQRREILMLAIASCFGCSFIVILCLFSLSSYTNISKCIDYLSVAAR